MIAPDTPAPLRRALPWWQRPWATVVALLLILTVGGYLRFVGLFTWDADTYQHPDERFLVYAVYNMQLPPSFAAYLQSDCAPNGYILNPRNPEEPPDQQEPTGQSGCNTLNPRNFNWSRYFVYGPLPLSATRLVGELWGSTTPEQLRDIGRALSALCDLGSVLLAFLIGRRLYGRNVGLVAALLLSLAVLHIQHAHFFTVDTFGAFFTMLALYWAVRVAQGGGVLTYAALGLAIGAGMAVRLTLATLGLLAIAATVQAILSWPTQQQARRRALRIGWVPEGEGQGRVWELAAPQLGALGRLGLLALAGATTLLTFRLLQPDAFVGTSFWDVRPEGRFLQDIAAASLTVSGEVDMPPSHQWAGRLPYWFPWKNMVLWGMGLPLGLAAWAGWALAGWRLIGRRETRHWLPWLWVTFWFAWQGGQFVLTQRYQLPIYGALCILAAWLVVWIAGSKSQIANWSLIATLRQRIQGFRRSASFDLQSATRWPYWRLVPLIAVVAGTLLWAYAFTRIYTRPHSRVEASRWIFANVAPGATVTSEQWDDALPLSIDGFLSSYVVDLQTQPYWEDAPEKFWTSAQTSQLGLLDQLDMADYIILSSNRVYDSVKRLPMRYPATLRYYNALFSGELGFEQVADIGSYPTLFGIPINDQVAEEAFSVYDHPRVLIFKKTERYERAAAERLLTEGVAWGEIYKLRPVQADKAPTALRLTDEAWRAQRDGGTWAALFDPSNLSNYLPVFYWLLVLELLGLAAFVLLRPLLPALPDGGWALAKMLALLLVAYGAWLLGSFHLLAFDPATVWLVAGLLLAAGAVYAWRDQAALGAFVRQRRAALLWGEAIFLLAFVALLLVRYANPDLWHPARGGEKPMDVALLNAVLKSSQFPPYDPWFAGGFINYYYFGFVLVGALIHLTGVVPSVAYNLAVPTLFALTAMGAWGVAYNLQAQAKRRKVNGATLTGAAARVERTAIMSGLLAALFVPVLGNLAQAQFYLSGYAAANAHRPEWAFWDATRLVEGAINEFPFFTFLFADLHAHMIALPLTTLALGLMVALVRAETYGPGGARGASLTGALVPVALLALTIGALRATNTWEYPTYLALALCTLALLAIRRWLRGSTPRALARLFGSSAALLLVGPTLLFYPFVRSFATDYQGIERWQSELTSLADWLTINGLWAVLLLTAGLLLLRRALPVGLASLGGGALGLVLFAAAAALMGLPAVTLTLPLVVGAVLLGLLLLIGGVGRAARLSVSAPSLWAGLLAVTALALGVAVELVRVQGDIGRMNTVFKFGLQAWTLAAIASALALPWAWAQLQHTHAALRYWWTVGVAALIVAALCYPLTATPARIADRMGPTTPRTLDGLAFAEAATTDENGQRWALKGDIDAMRWMQRHVGGSPVVLEAHTEAYRWGGRFATYTGLPTVLGWPWHQTQQRAVVEISSIIALRQQAIRDVYSSGEARVAATLVRRYGVEYVVVGGLEEALYPGVRGRMAALARTGLLQLVFDGPTQVYRVAPEAVSPPLVLHNPAPVQAPPPEHRATLMLDRPVDDLPRVGEYAWNPLGQTSWAAGLWWVLVLYVLALLGLPLSAVVFGGWRDGGWAWARLIGLLLLGYAVWLPVSARLTSYNRWGVLLGLLLVLALNAWALVRLARRAELPADAGLGAQLKAGVAYLRALLRERWRYVLAGEALFWGAWALLLAIRLFNPDLWHPIYGGEKPFEFGFLNAILRSPVMPPYDPFYSGGYINYYYYGLYLASLPIKITGVAPAIGFNLVVPTLFALLLSGAYALAAQVTGRGRYGLIAAACVALLGNMAAVYAPGGAAWMAQGAGPVLSALREGGLAGFGQLLGDWFWGPSRVIPYTINEFPFFSFLFADLHPHVVALPITLLALALAWNVLAVPGGSRPATLGLLALVLGTLAATNSWDFPTYALVVGLALVGSAYRAQAARPALLGALLRASALAVVLPLSGLLLFLPFFQHFRAQVQGIGLVTQPSPAASFLLIYGIWIALLVAVLYAMALRVLRHRQRPAASPLLGIVPLSSPGPHAPLVGTLARQLRVLLLVAPLLLLVALVLLPEQRLRLLLLALVVLGAGLLFERRLSTPAWFVALLATVGWAVSLGVEFIFVRDHLAGGDWERMNTVFKFGLQVWVLLALAAALALKLVWRALDRLSVWVGGGVAGLLTLGLIVGLVYPLAGTASRVAMRFPASPVPTLDGLAFMPTASFCVQANYGSDPSCGAGEARIDLRYDGEAIAWLNKYSRGTPIILQSEREFYRAYGVRVAANTGLPTVVGALHSDEQRPPAEVARRVADVQTIYDTTDEGQALRLLARYGVGYVYVGPIERALYRPEGIAKFDRLEGIYLNLVYRNEGVNIYGVNPNVRQLVSASLPVDVAQRQQPRPQPFPADEIAGQPGALASPGSTADLTELEARAAGNPGDAGAAYDLARRYRDLSRYDDAARVLAATAQANPDDVGLHHLWGDVLGDAGRFDDAAAAYRVAVEIEPTAGNYNKLGSSLLRWGRLEEAGAALTKAQELDPDAPEPYYFLGALYQQRGEADRARQAFERYIALDPGGPYRADAQARLAALQR